MTHPRPIPPEALPVVHRLRLEVERPKRLPKPDRPFLSLRWKRRSWRHMFFTFPYCPMGMLPNATRTMPIRGRHLRGFTTTEVASMALWWDDQTDPQAATDAIWPPDGRWCRSCGSRPVDPAMGTVPELYDCVDCDREVCGDCGEVEGDPDGNDGARCPGCREAA